jgi:ribosomal protein S18 acetylase RimI-like enzyme
MTLIPDSQFLRTLIRPVHLSDAFSLHKMCWPDRPLQNVGKLLDRTQKLAFCRRGLGVVAIRDNVLCGFGMLTLWPRAAEISDLIVNPGYRDQGIGSMIIAHLTEAARNLHTQMIEIGVALSNPRALALYRRLGFTDHHVVEVDLGNGPETVLYLTKSLVY